MLIFLVVCALARAAAAQRPAVAWTIAGSDSGGGAGIQADLQSFRSFDVHGCSVITALTAQNSIGVQHIELASTESVRKTLDALATDIPADAIKLGMLGSEAIVREVAAFLASGACALVVCDPVMISSSGTPLLDPAAVALMRSEMFPRCRLLTPNIPEAEALVGRRIRTAAEAEAAALEILQTAGCGAVLLKGGHAASSGVVQDVLCDGLNPPVWLSCERVEGGDAAGCHGTGCALSSAIAALLARGHDMLDAVVLAKAYVTQGIRRSERVGAGAGAVAHTGWPCTASAMPWVSRSACIFRYIYIDRYIAVFR